MFRHRITADTPAYRLPEPPAAPFVPGAFFACPVVGWVGPQPVAMSGVLFLYQQAFAQAAEVARPSILARDLAGVWN